MAVRTACAVDGQVFVAHEIPSEDDWLALSGPGLVVRSGAETSTESWAGLASVQVRTRGLWRRTAPGPVRAAIHAARLVYAIVAALLFVMTFGGLGGGPLSSDGSVEATLHKKGQPSVLANTYATPITWPRDCTELESSWFTIVIESLVGSSMKLDVVALTQILESVDTVAEFRTRLPELVKPQT